MGRTILPPEKQIDKRNINLGHIILFCEGSTEKYYFEYFTGIIEKNKYNDIVIEVESAGGDASRVRKYAEKYLAEEKNNRKYSKYKKYLVFDCDAPINIQQVIEQMCLSKNEYELLISNYMFETWLLMYFEDVTEKFERKEEIYERLSMHLTNDYEKANAGIIREIIQKGDSEKAIENAEKLAASYRWQGMDFRISVKEMNPYTNVNEFVVQLMSAIS